MPFEGIKIKKLTNFKEDYVCIGSYVKKNDTVVTKLKIQSKYSLMIIKFNNVTNDFKFNYHALENCNTPGHFSIIDESLYEVNFNSGVFDVNSNVNKIDFFSDSEIDCQIDNDSVKSFYLNFHKYVVKINNQEDKLIYGEIEYYGLKRLKANVLFYKIDGIVYMFIMTPIKRNIVLERNTLYNYLFQNS